MRNESIKDGKGVSVFLHFLPSHKRRISQMLKTDIFANGPVFQSFAVNNCNYIPWQANLLLRS